MTIDRIRETFPAALICGTALSPNKGTNPDTWYGNANFVNAIKKCDFVGVHFYSNPDDGSFTRQGEWNELTYAETSLWGACYYHVQTNAGGVDYHENVGSEGARGYRKRLSEGGL